MKIFNHILIQRISSKYKSAAGYLQSFPQTTISQVGIAGQFRDIQDHEGYQSHQECEGL